MSRQLVEIPTFDDRGAKWSELLFLLYVILYLNSEDWWWPGRTGEIKRYGGRRGFFDMEPG